MITIVIPAYNEERKIAATLEDIIAYIFKKQIQAEIIVVDDGSTDRTLKTIDSTKNKYSNIQLSVLSLGRNFGKGRAIREGMIRGKGDYLLFMDADNSTTIEEFDKFLVRTEEGNDIIIGTRRNKASRILERQPFYREFFGKGFRVLSSIITGAKVSDFTCGFKCFSQRAAKDIFLRAVINDWSFDAEILFLAHRLGYEIIEVPVQWKNDRLSKVRLLRDVTNSLIGLFKIRFYNIIGKYRYED